MNQSDSRITQAPQTKRSLELTAMRKAFSWTARIFEQGGEMIPHGKKLEILRAKHLANSFADLDESAAEFALSLVSGRSKPWARGRDEWALGFEIADSECKRICGVRIIERQLIVAPFTITLSDPHAGAYFAAYTRGCDALLISQPNDIKRAAVAQLLSRATMDGLPEEAIEIRVDEAVDYRGYLAGSWWTRLEPEDVNETAMTEAVVCSMQARTLKTTYNHPRPLSHYAYAAVRRARQLGLDVEETGRSLGLSTAQIQRIMNGQSQHPPTERQLTFAMSLSKRYGVTLSEEARRDSAACSLFIEELLKREKEKAPKTSSEAAEPATPKQISFVEKLLKEFPFLADHIGEDWRTDKRTTSRFLGKVTPKIEEMRSAMTTGGMKDAAKLIE